MIIYKVILSLIFIYYCANSSGVYNEIPESLDTLYNVYENDKIRYSVINSIISIRIDSCLFSDILPKRASDDFDSRNPELFARYKVHVNKTMLGVILDTSIIVEFRFLKNQINRFKNTEIDLSRNSLKEFMLNSGTVIGVHYSSIFSKILPIGSNYLMTITGIKRYREDSTIIEYKILNIFEEKKLFSQLYYKPLIIDSIFPNKNILYDKMISIYNANILADKIKLKIKWKSKKD